MDSNEFNQFQRRLFTQYPSVLSWLNEHSPDAAETLRSWQRRLSAYTLEQCLSVLERWEKSNSEPFKAYERDQLPSLIASVIASDEDKQRKRDQLYAERRNLLDSRQKRNANPMIKDVPSVLDSPMRAAVERLQPIHKKMLDGEISDSEYRMELETELAKL